MITPPFSPGNKGIPFSGDHSAGWGAAGWGAAGWHGWNVFGAHTTLPVALVLRSVLERNSTAMSEYCRRNGVSLAPHGKTTMSPELFELQLRDGAWGITAATVHQARVMRESGVPRVLIANEVTSPGDIAWLASEVGSDFQVMCYVDSLDGVQLLHEGLSDNGASGPLGVLVELGVLGGRTGVRSVEDALLVARAVSETSSLRLLGVAGFEGIIAAADNATAEERVDRFLNQLVRLAEAIIDCGLAVDLDEFIVSAGGSVFFDRVVATLGQAQATIPIRVVVRSGCYISHDDGVIDELSPLGAHPRTTGELFDAALEVWAPVLSRPETGRLILGAGKRDVSTDGLLPVAKKWVRRGTSEVRHLDRRSRVVRADDQHAYLDVDPSCEIQVGDYVGLGISHPCTTFDKWRVIMVVDDGYHVVQVISTCF